MLETTTVCEKDPTKTSVTPACAAVLEVYARFLAIVDRGKSADSLRIEKFEQDLVPGRLLLASGWRDGGHRRLERLVLRELDGKFDVVWFAPEHLSSDGERQVVKEVSLVALESYLEFMKARDRLDGFAKAHGVFTQQLRSWRGELVAKLGAQAPKEKLLALTGLLVAMLEKTPPPKPLTTLGDVPSKELQGLFAGGRGGRARWVGAPSKFEPLTVTGASVQGMVWGGADANWLLRVSLRLEPGGFRLERESVAFEQHFIE